MTVGWERMVEQMSDVVVVLPSIQATQSGEIAGESAPEEFQGS